MLHTHRHLWSHDLYDQQCNWRIIQFCSFNFYNSILALSLDESSRKFLKLNGFKSPQQVAVVRLEYHVAFRVKIFSFITLRLIAFIQLIFFIQLIVFLAEEIFPTASYHWYWVSIISHTLLLSYFSSLKL